MFKRFICVLCISSVLTITVQAQGIINVNESTGTLGLNIPLFNVHNGGLSVPVSLSYSATGVKVKDIEGSAGMNWQLNAGGHIIREVRGLPDECTKNMSGQSRLGWLNNTNGAAINSFNILNNNGSTCADTTDLRFITNHFSGLTDTEPDMFYVSAPGLRCRFVFDNAHHIQVIPFQDLQVSYVIGADSSITSFTIVNDNGVKYTFADSIHTIRTTHSNNPSLITYLKQDYNQYSGAIGMAVPDHGIKYVSSWNLTQIADINGNVINFNYWCSCFNDPPDCKYLHSVDTVNMYVGAASNTFTKSYQYEIRTSTLLHHLTDITYGYGNTIYPALSFIYVNSLSSGTPLITTLNGYGKTIHFNYVSVGKVQPKNYLTGLSSTSSGDQCTDPNSYHFDYINLTKNTGADSLNYPYLIGIPDSTSSQMDYWGYYNANGATKLVPQTYVNPSNTSERYRVISPTNNHIADYPYLLSGVNRDQNSTTVLYGTLNKITYAGGGTTTLTYEPNDFYDNTATTVVQGGGIRIRQITTYDGLNTANNIVKTYYYTDPSTGLSSGKPITIPQFAFTTSYTGSGTALDKWNYSTVRSSDNLSPEDNTILYTNVKESQTGTGSTLYQFLQPATNWDASASPDWSPTITFIGRTGCAADGFMTNSKNTYPFPPNTNFDFERNLPSKVINYADNGNEVSETAYSYSRTGSPTVITGFKFDNNGTTVAYAKYNIYAATSELQTVATTKVFDSQSQTTSQQTIVNLTYANAQHKLTQQQITNSNGIIQNNYTKYVKDYTVSLGADSTANGIYRLQKLNVNIPVETYSTVTQSGVIKTTNASLVKFRTVNPTGSAYLYLPFQKLNFVAPDGVTGFAQSSVSGSTFSNYSGYIPVENDLAYDFTGYLLSADDNNKHVQTTITDHTVGLPVASVTNARYNEIGYNDFNSDITPVTFTKTGTNTLSANARSGQFSLSLPASTVMSRTITKNTTAGKYIFSVWIYSASAGTMNVSLTDGTHTNADTISYAGNSKWTYYEKKMPLTSLGTTITASFQSGTAVLIDDVFFYPDVAEVSTIAYDPATFQKTSQTNTSGVSNYFTYDMFNRPLLTYDQDKNILSRTNYYLGSSQYNLSQIDFESTYLPAINSPVNFTIIGIPDCFLNQVSASWNFGDGSAVVTGLNPSHTYTSIGKKVVSLTVSSIFFGTKTIIDTVKVNPSAPTAIPIHYTNNVGPNLSPTSRGALTTITFQGSAAPYTFTETDLISGGVSIPQDNYSVSFTVTTAPHLTPLWNSLNFNNGSDIYCWPRSSGASGTISLNLSTSTVLNLTLNTTNCSF